MLFKIPADDALGKSKYVLVAMERGSGWELSIQ